MSDYVEDDQPQLDPDDPGEVPTAFVTKGTGWSGRDEEDDDSDE